MNTAQQNQLNSKKASFRAKESIYCPICNEAYIKEQMFQGGGRLIAGKVTQELRRLYEKNKKFGRIHPSDYSLSVCTKCLFTCFSRDWSNVNPQEKEKIKLQTHDRRLNLEKILGPLDFNQDRNIILGAASYLLAIDCYQLRSKAVAPTAKKAICALRAAWYFDDIHAEFGHLAYDKVRDLMYQKAAIWYGLTLEYMQTGAEKVEEAASLLGPDSDNNWGTDGVIYLNAYLARKFYEILSTDPEKRLDILVRAKRMLAKLYGSGKSSKSKPSALNDMTKELYDEMGVLVDSLGGEK